MAMASVTKTYVTKGSMTAVGLLFPALAVMSLALRAYGSRGNRRKLGIDDILIIPAGVSQAIFPYSTILLRMNTDRADQLCTIGTGLAIAVGRSHHSSTIPEVCNVLNVSARGASRSSRWAFRSLKTTNRKRL